MSKVANYGLIILTVHTILDIGSLKMWTSLKIEILYFYTLGWTSFIGFETRISCTTLQWVSKYTFRFKGR